MNGLYPNFVTIGEPASAFFTKSEMPFSTSCRGSAPKAPVVTAVALTLSVPSQILTVFTSQRATNLPSANTPLSFRSIELPVIVTSIRAPQASVCRSAQVSDFRTVLAGSSMVACRFSIEVPAGRPAAIEPAGGGAGAGVSRRCSVAAGARVRGRRMWRHARPWGRRGRLATGGALGAGRQVAGDCGGLQLVSRIRIGYDERPADPSPALLHGVNRFVCDERVAGTAAGPVLISPEEQIVAHGESARGHRGSQRCGVGAGVDASGVSCIA